MKISEQIKRYRKEANLTQEQVANYLGVSTPAVNKWEKGSTYPDIALIPAISRLLKIDLNDIFSFHGELTEFEIAQFANELSEIALGEGIVYAFEAAVKKIQEYPRCDLLLYMTATVLDGARILSVISETQNEEYENKIIGWLEQAADSEDDKVRMQAVFMLAAKYNQKQEYDKASLLLDKVPNVTIDTTLLRTEVLIHQEDENSALAFLESNFLQTAGRMQGYFYRLIEMEEQSGNHQKADEIAVIAEKVVSLLGLWNYGTVIPSLILAVYRKDVERSIKLIRSTLEEAQKPWNIEESLSLIHI